jgi:hypothetical protein
MNPLTRAVAGIVVLFAAIVAIVAISSPGLAAPTSVSTAPALTAAMRHAIIAAPHPDIRTACRGELFVSWHRWTQVRGHRVLVAQVGCKYGTSGSPQDTGVYTKHGYQRYLLDRGKAFTRGKYWITTANFRVRAPGVVAIRYDGYAPKDALCCPTRFYARTFHLSWSHAVAGGLRRIATSGD